jgi:hypothetical protein
MGAYWIGFDPDIVNVCACEAHHFEAHERDLVDEGEVARDELGDVEKRGSCLFVEDDPDTRWRGRLAHT